MPDEDYGCEFELTRSVVSAPIPMNASHPGVDNSWCLIDEIVAAEERPLQSHLSNTNCYPHQDAKHSPGLEHSQHFAAIQIHSHNLLIQGLEIL